MKYQRTQFSWMMTIIFSIVLIAIVASYVFTLGQHPVDLTGLLILGTIMLLCLLTFYSLTVSIRQKSIHLRFGIGLIQFTIKPERITELQAVKVPFYAGTGIRITPTGMLYNIQGSNAVKLTFTKGERTKTIRIGTDEPAVLLEAIKTEFM